MSKKLKPCPFCGGKAVLESWGDNPKSDRHWIACYSLSCKRRFNGGLETGFYKSPKSAIKAWNKRAK